MSNDSLSIFSGPQPQVPGLSPGAPRIGKDPVPPAMRALVVSLNKTLAAVATEQKESQKKFAANSLAFPYEVQVEEQPQPKIRFVSGVSTYLIVVVDPVTQKLGFSKYAFLPPDTGALIERLLTEAGFELDEKKPGHLQIGQYVRPSGF